MLALTALVAVLWQTPVVLPLKLLVVFFHETSHAAAALRTGGPSESISINPFEGGVTVTRGGNLFALLGAGYPGSLSIGVAILLIALRTDLDRELMGLLGFVALVIAALYLRDAAALARAFGGYAVVWGGLWLALSLAVIAACLRAGLGARSTIRPRRK